MQAAVFVFNVTHIRAVLHLRGLSAEPKNKYKYIYINISI